MHVYYDVQHTFLCYHTAAAAAVAAVVVAVDFANSVECFAVAAPSG